MSEILVFTVFHMACLPSDGEHCPVPQTTAPALEPTSTCTVPRSARDAHSLPGVPRNTKSHSSPLLASACGTGCDSSPASWAQAQVLRQLDSPNHKIALCNDWGNRAWFSIHLQQTCPSRAAWTSTELLLIYPDVIRKQLFSVTFQVKGVALAEQYE